MKKTTRLLAVFLTAAIATASPVLAFAPPTEDQIAKVLADHTALNPLVTGVSGEDAASVVASVITAAQGSTLPAASKAQTSALLYTRALLLSGENAPAMAQALAGKIAVEIVPPIAAATAIAAGGAGAVIDALKAGAGASSAAAIDAAVADPASALGADGVALVQQLVIELRGVAAPVIPPPSTAPLPLVPPIVPLGQRTPAPPPVADTYLNQ